MKGLALVFSLAIAPFLATPDAGYQAAQQSFEGNWGQPSNSTTVSAAKIFKDPEEGWLNVQVWGSCTPKPCDWGGVRFHTLSNRDRTEQRGFATFPAPRYATFRLDGEDLVVEVYSMPDRRVSSQPWSFTTVRLKRVPG
jgi:hypothetical protein